jgi:hypothetical protein
LPEFRVVVAFDMTAEDREAAAAFAKDVAMEQVGRKKRASGAAAREGGYRSPTKLPYIFRADIIEVRDH